MEVDPWRLDQRRRVHVPADGAGYVEHVLEIGRAILVGRRADGDEDDRRALDRLRHVLPEIVEDGSGLLWEPFEECAEQTRRLCADDALRGRLSDAARRRAGAKIVGGAVAAMTRPCLARGAVASRMLTP